MTLIIRISLCVAALFLASCSGDSNNSIVTSQSAPTSAETNGLLVRGPLQAKTDNQLIVMGQSITISDNTVLTDTSYDNLRIGDIVAVFGQRQGSLIVSVEIRVEAQTTSHIIVGTPELNVAGQYSIGDLLLTLSADISADLSELREYIMEGQFDSNSGSINIVQLVEQNTGGTVPDDHTASGESGDRLYLDLEGGDSCVTTGSTELYRLMSVELTADARMITRDISTETIVSPSHTVVSVDSVSERGIGLQFAQQGITGVEFNNNNDLIVRYFASLDTSVQKPVILQSTGTDYCAFAYFPANSSACAIAVNNTQLSTGGTNVSTSVSVQSSSGGNGGSNGQAGTSGENGISVVNNNGVTTIGDEIIISDCTVQSSNGIPVIMLNH
jgi:hypothetical protein